MKQKALPKISSALAFNLGTPTSEQMQAMQILCPKQHSLDNIPWVLDPVGYGRIFSLAQSNDRRAFTVQAKRYTLVMPQKSVRLQGQPKFNLKVWISP